jgi:hypothetical protein
MAGVTQYGIFQRQGTSQNQLGVVAAPPYTGPLPARGVTYEYMVLSIAGTRRAASAWIPYTVPADPLPTGRGTIVTDPTRPPPSPTIISAGPATLTATSVMPSQIMLNWSPVQSATAYRIRRVSNAPFDPGEVTVVEIPATPGSPVFVNGRWEWGDAVDERLSYTYRVIALFSNVPGIGPESHPSPSASAQSLPHTAPKNLKFTVRPAIQPGTMTVTVTWDPVVYSSSWILSGFIPGMPSSTGAPTFTVTNVPFRLQPYEVCVTERYGPMPSNLKSCVSVPASR